MAYEIVRYSSELRDQVIALDQHLVSPDHELNSKYFHWKHEENPYTTGPILYVAMAGNKVVGKRAFHGARWHLDAGGASALWLCICDLVVAPEHRGQHLFQRISEVALPALCAEGHRCFLNWSASPISYFGYLKTGWRLVGPYARLVRETPSSRVTRYIRSRTRRLPLIWRYADRIRSFREGFEAFDEAWSRKSHDRSTTISAEPEPRAMAKLVADVARDGVCHERDQTYYRWRFANPLAEHRFVFCRQAETDGFLALRIGRFNDWAEISIVDWEAKSPKIFEAMLTDVVQTGGYDSLSIWSTARAMEEVACLTRLGFRLADDTRGNARYRPGLLAYTAAGSTVESGGRHEAHALDSLDRWNLRMAYSDYY